MHPKECGTAAVYELQRPDRELLTSIVAAREDSRTQLRQPGSMIYSSVVSRESVRIAFATVAQNDLDIPMAYIGSACLNVDCRKKIWEQGQSLEQTKVAVSYLLRRGMDWKARRAHLAKKPTSANALEARGERLSSLVLWMLIMPEIR